MESCIYSTVSDMRANHTSKTYSTYLTPSRTSAVYSNAVLSAIIALGGIIGNSTIITAFFRRKALRNVNNIFLVQLAFVDLTKAVFILPVKVYTNLSLLSKEQHMKPCIDLGYYCKISGFISTITFIHSALLLAAIGVVRYVKMVRSVSFNRIFSRRNTACYCLMLALPTIILALLPVIGVGLYAYSPYHGVCFTNWARENKTYRIIFYIYIMGVGYVAILFSYGSIYLKLRQHRKNTQASLDSAKFSSYQGRYRKRSNSNRSANEERSSQVNNEKQSQVSAGCISIGCDSEIKDRNSEVSTVPPPQPNESSQKLNRTVKSPDDRTLRTAPTVRSHSSFRVELKVTKVMFAIVVAYTVCWVPAFIVNIIMLSTQGTSNVNSQKIDPVALFYIITVVDLKVLLNPIIYGIWNGQFRKEIKGLFSRVLRYF
ncbi:probable G-protein coupled receptor No18 [Rhopilema esculentum]|uniref:probable G-protein coupled receptor No18 n=1 Tax=Rhopilema esculentum TaxID=499914 RepID=UPI0031E47D87|eukprot:gene4430-20665_t